MKRILFVTAGVAAAVVPVASAHVGSEPMRPQSAESSALLARVSVAASEFKFVLSKKSARRGVVVFRVKNVGKVSHDFAIKARKTKLLSPGQSATLRITFLRKGSYPYKCTVPGHAAAGMKGIFKIT
ncbi:MAG TPA: plastocyanin/azurin family copper-binding protein [Gaiellaceae bacterium]|nr:plastocyanin/azurin family copper-binding protein [Gaiellaceae bacterium]